MPLYLGDTRADGTPITPAVREQDDILICRVRSKIVGIQYCERAPNSTKAPTKPQLMRVVLSPVLLSSTALDHGVVHAGELANVVREPHNPYDRNAIKITSLNGV